MLCRKILSWAVFAASRKVIRPICILKALRSPAAQCLLDSGFPTACPGTPVRGTRIPWKAAWEAVLDAGYSEAGHSFGDRPGLLQEMIYELESQVINLPGSHICLPNRSIHGSNLPEVVPPSGELNVEASKGLEVG